MNFELAALKWEKAASAAGAFFPRHLVNRLRPLAEQRRIIPIVTIAGVIYQADCDANQEHLDNDYLGPGPRGCHLYIGAGRWAIEWITEHHCIRLMQYAADRWGVECICRHGVENMCYRKAAVEENYEEIL